MKRRIGIENKIPPSEPLLRNFKSMLFFYFYETIDSIKITFIRLPCTVK